VESPSGFRIDVAAPGFTRESFEAKIENDLLIISGKTENEPENKAEKFTTRQFNYHSFQKTYKLPKSVNQENISAFYKEGILTVVLSKKEEAVPASKSISIL
jgi:HSP20 family protein